MCSCAFFFFLNRAINYFTWGSFVVAVFKKERKQCNRPLCFPSLRHMPVVLTPFPSSVFHLRCLLAFLCFYCWWQWTHVFSGLQSYYIFLPYSPFQLTRSEICCSTTFLLHMYSSARTYYLWTRILKTWMGQEKRRALLPW